MTRDYDVVVTTPRSIRFDSGVTARLASYVARHPGLSGSSVAARLVDEGLRMDEHPGVLFRQGPAGRRAALLGGPDVWEVVRAARSARAAEPELAEHELIALLEDNAGVPARLIRTALDYWGTYPDEVEALIEHAERVEHDAVQAAERTAALLSG